jgi:transcriptional regulator with XRE-family HTH domain
MSEHLKDNEVEPDQSERASDFGFMLETMREASHLSTRELAKRSGLQPAEVTQLEQGEYLPSAEAKQKLEEVFDCTLYLEPHKEVVVQVGDKKAEIDEVIAPLIREVWIAGIRTVMSCQQDVFGRVWIMFPDPENAVAFLNIVGQKFEEGSESLYVRMNDYCSSCGHIPKWVYNVGVSDLRRMDGIVPPDYPADFTIHVSVRFPQRDLPTVVRRLQEHNLEQGQESSPAVSDLSVGRR